MTKRAIELGLSTVRMAISIQDLDSIRNVIMATANAFQYLKKPLIGLMVKCTLATEEAPSVMKNGGINESSLS